ncbi:MAG: hypothetical protein ACTS47_01630 [Candidatus Hodgkinia cicadicola]
MTCERTWRKSLAKFRNWRIVDFGEPTRAKSGVIDETQRTFRGGVERNVGKLGRC